MRIAISIVLLVTATSPAQGLKSRIWVIEGVKREALVIAPEKPGKAVPLVFVFHGHGGTAKHAATRYAFHKHWPEAVTVYPQGLPTPGKLTDPEGKKAGWQHGPGSQDDRDLKFFDAMLSTLKKDFPLDPKRVYSTGHSNGGGFTYTLWAVRGDVFAAVAPSSAVAGFYSKLKPKPVLHLAGEKDTLVKYDWQRRMIDQLRKLNGCDSSGKPAGKYCTQYSSKDGPPAVTYIHPGGHAFPPEAPAQIVEFFKDHSAK